MSVLEERTEHYIFDQRIDTNRKPPQPQETADAAGAFSLLYLSQVTMHFLHLLLPFLTPLFLLQSTLAAEFSLDGFNPSDLLLCGTATLNSRVLSLTKNITFSIGRALYHTKISTRSPNSSKLLPFSTSFNFSINPYKNYLPGHGLVFIFVPSTGIQGASSAQHLGFLNRSNDGDPNNHVFGIEFDVFQNQEFNDINNDHVGVDVNSLTSLVAYKAGYWLDGDRKSDSNSTNWSFKDVRLNSGAIYRVWIEYLHSQLKVTMAPGNMKKPGDH